MGQHLRYSKKQQRWRIYYRIVKDGKTIASDEIYAKKKGPALDWPKIPTKKQQEYLRANSYLPSDKDVREMMVRLDNEVANRGSTYETNDKITIAQLCDMFMDKANLGRVTNRRIYKSNIRYYIKPCLGHIRIKELSPRHQDDLMRYVEKYIVYRKISHKPVLLSEVRKIDPKATERKPRSTVRVLQNLKLILDRSFLPESVDDGLGLIPYNPWSGLPIPKVLKKKLIRHKKAVQDNKIYLKPEQIKAIINNFGNSLYKFPTILLAETGMREGEVLGLKWKDFDEEEKTIFVRREVVKQEDEEGREYYSTEDINDGIDELAKALSTGKIYLSDTSIKILKKQKDFQSKKYAVNEIIKSLENNKSLKINRVIDDEDYVFTSIKTGHLLRPNGIYKQFKRAVARAKANSPFDIPTDVHPHDLRSAQASLLHKKGYSLKDISNRLRHSQIETTANIYTILTEESKREIAEGGSIFDDTDI